MPTIPVEAETRPAPSAANRLRRLWARWLETYRKHEERRELYRLDDHELKDFGATKLDVEAAARRRFRDLPPMA